MIYSMDSVVQWLNHYPVDMYHQNLLTYLVDSDLSTL